MTPILPTIPTVPVVPNKTVDAQSESDSSEEASTEATEATSEATSEANSLECRICFDKITAQCIAPCACRGTAMFVCLPCYYKLVKSSQRCQSCRTEFPPCSVAPIIEYLWRAVTLSVLGVWVLVAVVTHVLVMLAAYLSVTLLTTQHNVVAIAGSVSGVLIIQRFWHSAALIFKSLIFCDASAWTTAIRVVETVASVAGIELVIQNGSTALNTEALNEILNSNIQIQAGVHVFQQNQQEPNQNAEPTQEDEESEQAEESEQDTESDQDEESEQDTESEYETDQESESVTETTSEESGYQEMLDAVLYEDSDETTEMPVVLLKAQ